MSLIKWLSGLFRGPSPSEAKDAKDANEANEGAGASLRAVPGAAALTSDGNVVYNALDPAMQQFMGRCIGAVKRSGVLATGTGQFSIAIDDGKSELILDEYWKRACREQDDDAVIADVVAAAQSLAEV